MLLQRRGDGGCNAVQRLNASTVGAERSQRRGGRCPSIGFAEEAFDWVCCVGGATRREVRVGGLGVHPFEMRVIGDE
jgi:hypothetical protein